MAEPQETAEVVEEQTQTQDRPLGSLFGPEHKEPVQEDHEDTEQSQQQVKTKEPEVGVQEEKPETEVTVEAEAEQPGNDWDSQENPYLKRSREWQGKYDQAVANAQRMERQVQRLQQQVDGTYDPDQEQQAEQARLQAEINARAQTSRVVAVERYGEEAVNETTQWFDTTFANDVGMQNRILYSQAPFLEAIKLKEEHDFFSEYGRPKEAIEKIRKQVAAEMREELKKEVKEELFKKGKTAREVAPSISEVQGSSEPQKKITNAPKPLDQVFRLGG